MAMTDELERLARLKEQGALSDEEYAQAKARVLGGHPGVVPPAVQAVNAFRRSRNDRWLGGVCGGLSVATGMASWIWRLIFVLAAFLGGFSIIVYIALWLFVPDD